MNTLLMLFRDWYDFPQQPWVTCGVTPCRATVSTCCCSASLAVPPAAAAAGCLRLALSDATRRLCARTDVRQLVGPSKGILQWKLPRLLESDTRVDECLKQLLLLILQCGWVAKGHKTRLLTLYHESHTWPTLAGLFST